MRRIIGPDVSFYQDDPNTPKGIDFVRMRQVADFVIIRVGQNQWVDRDFRKNWQAAKQAGLPRGSYWFYDSRADPKQQAELWVNTMGNDMGELPLFADLEEAYGGQYRGWTHWKQFIERLRVLVGQKEIGIYTAYYYWQTNAPNPITQAGDLEYFHRYPLWIANYGVEQPLVPKPWGTNEWLFWQFTAMGDGIIYGVESSRIDLNYFNGDAQAFAQRFNVAVPDHPAPPDPIGNKYTVNVGSLYVREGPGTNFKAIGYLQRNDIVEAFASNADGTWLQVRRLTDGLMGWCSAAYLVRVDVPPQPEPEEPPDDQPTGKRYRVNAGTLYVREGPATTFKAIGFLKRDEIVDELGSNLDGSWKRVRRPSDQLTGWCSATYLVLVSTSPPPEEPPPPPPPPDDTVGVRYRVTATRLHVREGPGTTFKSLGYVELNEIVHAIGVNADESWRQVRRNDGLLGWSSARYLVLAPPPPEPDEPPTDENAGEWYRVTATRLNIREEPSASSKSLGYLSTNEAVEALSANADKTWIRFRKVDGLLGWASINYLVKLGKTPASAMQKVFPGVTYYRNERKSPRKMVSHVLVVDLKSDGVRFLVTPPLRDTLPQLCTKTTSRFLTENGMRIAVNGDGFYYLDPSKYKPQDYCPSGGDPVRLVGYAASRGKVYSEKEPGRPILFINQNNEVTFDVPKGKVYNAVSGDRMLVVKGKKVSGLETTRFDPRTALGFNQNGRWMYLVVVDGRESSEGASFSELADILLSQGAYTAMSLDGGGSSTMVIEGFDGRPRVLNTLIDEGIPGRERAVANHLGLFLKK
jgi:GH25 family lysozyme M1 (1,4-beta-N-acetylmuramidase)/SH3-like domain-containing protein